MAATLKPKPISVSYFINITLDSGVGRMHVGPYSSYDEVLEAAEGMMEADSDIRSIDVYSRLGILTRRRPVFEGCETYQLDTEDK